MRETRPDLSSSVHEDPPLTAERILVVPGDGVATVFNKGSAVQVPIRTMRRYAEFAAAMQQHSAVPVDFYTEPGIPVIDGRTLLVTLPYVLHDLHAAQGVTHPMAYVAIIDAPSFKIPELLASEPAALADKRSYEAWRHNSGTSAELFGHRSMSDRIDAALKPWPGLEQGAYALMHRDGVGLPGLLSTYLNAYCGM